MFGRRRIGLGLAISATLHAAAAALVLSTASKPNSDEPPIELELAEIEILDEEPDPADPNRPPKTLDPPETRPPPDPPLRRDEDSPPPPSPAPKDPSPTPTPPRPPPLTLHPAAPPTDTAPTPPARITTKPDPGAKEQPPGTWSDPPPAQGAPPGTAPRHSLDPRTAVDALALDPGPPPAAGPLDPFRPRRPTKTRSELRPAGPAGFETNGGVFVAHTARDGTVTFEDQANLQIDIPKPTPRRIAIALEDWYDSLAPNRAAIERANPEGEATGGGPTLVGGTFDLTDGALRAAGEDPYTARKMDFLDRTRDERQRLAAGEKSAALRQALHRTTADLERLWTGPGTPAQKRELLFLLWDECLERGTDEEVRTARAIRGTIQAFIRRHLARGTKDGYGPAELTQLNHRRTSTEPFAPYAK